MSDTASQPIAAACRNAADCLMRLLAVASDPHLMAVCSAGLHELADHYDTYRRVVKTGEHFIRELADEVSILCPEMPFHSPEEAHDKAFALVEMLALIMRETALRTLNRHPAPVQEEIMRYFEQSGHWRPAEGTLVTDYYYTRIPIGVIQSLVDSLRAPEVERAQSA